ncbi:MAG: pyridine nucleotide-disulfide oxidoreductase, partial [Kiloniellales bacterium]|nr:pyridine nucleotide-disulfide oxidoreductase [Kiloniellales bacterium]
MSDLQLAFDLAFGDLYSREGIARIDDLFVAHLIESDKDLSERLGKARESSNELTSNEESDLLLDLAPYLDDFLSLLFGIREEVLKVSEHHNALAPIYSVKRLFVQRQALKKVSRDEAAALDGQALEGELEKSLGGPLSELSFAKGILAWEQEPEVNEELLKTALHYAAWASLTEAGQLRWPDGVLFRQPRKIDPLSLISLVEKDRNATRLLEAPETQRRERHGFD